MRGDPRGVAKDDVGRHLQRPDLREDVIIEVPAREGLLRAVGPRGGATQKSHRRGAWGPLTPCPRRWDVGSPLAAHVKQEDVEAGAAPLHALQHVLHTQAVGGGVGAGRIDGHHEAGAKVLVAVSSIVQQSWWERGWWHVSPQLVRLQTPRLCPAAPKPILGSPAAPQELPHRRPLCRGAAGTHRLPSASHPGAGPAVTPP